MTNKEITEKFLSVTDAATRKTVLKTIAKHYGISQADALAEITHDDAEHLLDYLVDGTRAGVYALMIRHGLV